MLMQNHFNRLLSPGLRSIQNLLPVSNIRKALFHSATTQCNHIYLLSKFNGTSYFFVSSFMKNKLS